MNSVLHIMLIVAHLVVGEQPNRNDGENEQGDNYSENWHGLNFIGQK